MSEYVVGSTTLDDQGANITYAGNQPWTVHTNQQSIFHLYNSSDTFTDEQYATATLKFYGTGVDYYGNQGPYHGPCKITLDGTDVGTANSHAAADGYPILLYSNNNLELGDHTLVITVMGAEYPNVCEIDRFVVNVTEHATYTSSYVYTGPGSQPTGAPVPSTGSNNNSDSTSSKSSPPVAAIAGAVGGAAVLALLLVGWWLWRRKHRSKGAQKQKTRPPPLKNSGSVSPFLGGTGGNNGPMSPNEIEKAPLQPHGAVRPGEYTQPSSYIGTSPPASSYTASSPPASTVGFANPGHGYIPPGVASYAIVGHPSPPTSPQPTMRPTSVVSSAPTMTTTSYYTSGAPTTVESGFPGFVPQHQPVAPVWATPAAPSPSVSPAPTTPAGIPVPTSTPSPAPVSERLHPADEAALPEKARYTRRNDPASAGESSSGKAPLPTADAGSSSAGAGGSGSGSQQPARQQSQSDPILSPVVPDAPPPAYQL